MDKQLTDQKYLVFKPDELLEFMGSLLPTEGDCAPAAQRITENLKRLMLKDATVLRHKDLFAQVALYAYASAVQSGIEVLESLGEQAPASLRDLADHFFQEAEMARLTLSKVPD